MKDRGYNNLLGWGKYRKILISVALFLTFDLGVLIPNLLVSSQLKQDAIGINLSGRQRMLSQRTVKALLLLQLAHQANKDITVAQQELAIAYKLFDQTLTAFNSGGMVTGGDGQAVFLASVESDKAKSLVKQALEIWLPYQQKLIPILTAENTIDPEKLAIAIAYGQQQNRQLLSLMNSLTFELEQIANHKATNLQLFQTIGILLALLNFFILLYHTLIKLKASDAEIAHAHEKISALNQQLTAENLRLNAEIDVTRKLQQMILPKDRELSKIRDLDIAGFMEPAAEVGGDYYDVLHSNGRVKIGIGDVTGHGLESGVLMIMVQTAVRTLLANNETDPVKFLNALNSTIYNNVQRMNSEKNLTLCLLDYSGGVISLSGQHEEMIVVRYSGVVECIDTIDLGFPIGLESDITDFVASTRVELQPGDVVVLYTDGITEAENPQGEFYGLERLCEVVKQNWQGDAADIRQAAIADLRQHIGEQKLYDDITLLVIKQK
ncbi:MAG: SpoIIE family protein phosphatase [Hormoscilla sp.]